MKTKGGGKRNLQQQPLPKVVGEESHPQHQQEHEDHAPKVHTLGVRERQVRDLQAGEERGGVSLDVS